MILRERECEFAMAKEREQYRAFPFALLYFLCASSSRLRTFAPSPSQLHVYGVPFGHLCTFAFRAKMRRREGWIVRSFEFWQRILFCIFLMLMFNVFIILVFRLGSCLFTRMIHVLKCYAYRAYVLSIYRKDKLNHGWIIMNKH